MAHIKPEHLLEPRDYRQWMKAQSDSMVVNADNNSSSSSSLGCAVNDAVFESLSKRAWMDVLLQIIKVPYHTCAAT